MAKDRFRRSIAAALAGPSARDSLLQVLADYDDALEPARAAGPSLHAILDNVKDPIVTVGADGRVLGANVSAGRLFATAPAELVGGDIAALIPQLTPARPALEALAES